MQTYRALFDAARAARVAAPAMSEVHARLGMAQEMDALCDTANAIEQLRAVIALTAVRAVRRDWRARNINSACALDRAGRRSEAVAAYRNALASIPRDDRLQLAREVACGDQKRRRTDEPAADLVQNF